jgi:hypothetical protein
MNIVGIGLGAAILVAMYLRLRRPTAPSGGAS